MVPTDQAGLLSWVGVWVILVQYLMVISAKHLACFIRPVKTLVKDGNQFSGFDSWARQFAETGNSGRREKLGLEGTRIAFLLNVLSSSPMCKSQGRGLGL